MWKALWYKELRETAWLTLPALGVYALFVLDVMRVPLLPQPVRMLLFLGQEGRTGDIPFLHTKILQTFGWITGLLALTLGLWQTVGEERQGTYPLLLHLSLTRRSIVAVKLAWGIGVLVVLGAAVLLILSFWAATPGTHPSPFDWSMTIPSWGMWLGTSIVYLGAFLAGIRPGRWHGTRLLPLLTAGMVMFALQVGEIPLILWATVWVATNVGLLLAIDHMVHVRDFS